jgi:hypothetical protein
MRTFPGQAVRVWKATLGHVGDFQARLLLTVLYFTLLVPFGLPISLFGDPLQTRGRRAASGWIRRTPQPIGLEKSRRQF